MRPSDVGGLSGKVQDFEIVRLSNCELWEHVGTVNHDLLLLS